MPAGSFLFLLSLCITACYSSVVCLADTEGQGPANIPCVFPFTIGGRSYSSCISNVTGGILWCPTEVDWRGSPVQGKWGICHCTVERICDELKEIRAVKGKVDTNPVKDLRHPILNCTWHIVNPNHASQVAPTTIFFATQYRINDADLILRDNKDRHQIMSVRGSDNVAWTTQKEFWVHLTSPAGASTENFHGSFYSGFCSDVDGDMDLPTFDFQISSDPYIPLITDKYLVAGNTTQLNGTYDFDYRPNSYCNWNIPSYSSSFPGRQKNLYFYKFDLGEGDTVEVFVENRYHGMEKVHVFTKNNPPVPVTTTQRMAVTFISDGNSQGKGFQADVYRETCSPRTVPLRASFGTIKDGSTPGTPYPPRQSCSWHVSRPGERIIVELKYYKFYPNDVLTVFEGTGLDGKLLAVYSGNSTVLSRITGQEDVYITFKTQDRKSIFGDYGFELDWKVCDAKCRTCSAGTYFDFQQGSCTACPSWTVSQAGSDQCLPCAKGSKWTSPSKCEYCFPGTVSHDGRTCEECPTGTVAETEGLETCSKCQNRTYASNGTFCAPCGEGREMNDTGNGCKEIPVPQTPQNNTAVLIYGGVGIGVLLLIGAGIGYTQWKKNRSYSNEYLPLPSFS